MLDLLTSIAQGQQADELLRLRTVLATLISLLAEKGQISDASAQQLIRLMQPKSEV